jgi:hypothetical protein
MGKLRKGVGGAIFKVPGIILFMLTPFIYAVIWLTAAILIAGAWLDCVRGSSEYPCPSQALAWLDTLTTLAVSVLFTWIVRAAERRFRRRS